jgi:hypothetical protein
MAGGVGADRAGGGRVSSSVFFISTLAQTIKKPALSKRVFLCVLVEL